MTTQAGIGFGSQFLLGDGAAPENFTALAEVVSIQTPKRTQDTVDVTHMGSTNATREFIAGLNDQGEVQVTFNYLPGGAAETAILAVFNDRAQHNGKIVFPNNVSWKFAMIPTGFDAGQLTVDGKREATATFKLTGSTITAGVGP